MATDAQANNAPAETTEPVLHILWMNGGLRPGYVDRGANGNLCVTRSHWRAVICVPGTGHGLPSSHSQCPGTDISVWCSDYLVL